jgi:hypothetical protein
MIPNTPSTQSVVRISDAGNSDVFNISGGTFTIQSSTSVKGWDLPVEFSLSQNYPNPFNPSTVIRYSIPEQTYVEIVVYDRLGQSVMKLVGQEQQSGYHEIRFDASHLPSGIYIYRLRAGGFVASKKLMLLK